MLILCLCLLEWRMTGHEWSRQPASASNIIIVFICQFVISHYWLLRRECFIRCSHSQISRLDLDGSKSISDNLIRKFGPAEQYSQLVGVLCDKGNAISARMLIKKTFNLLACNFTLTFSNQSLLRSQILASFERWNARGVEDVIHGRPNRRSWTHRSSVELE